jgi:hypothetical protein
MTDKLIFTKNGIDITEGIDLRNGKANPFGWSTYEIWLTERLEETLTEIDRKIGDLYCGEPRNMVEGFNWRIVAG